LTVTLEDPAHPGQPFTALPAALLTTFRVKGELSGPGLAAPQGPGGGVRVGADGGVADSAAAPGGELRGR